jgi:Ser/Thr protein kinase RdoA (MazF antagonist)
MPKLDRQLVIRTLAGYAEVNKITEAERRAWLAAMTGAQARALFDDLCASWDHSAASSGADWQSLDRWRIEQKIAVRRAFERLAQAQGLV